MLKCLLNSVAHHARSHLLSAQALLFRTDLCTDGSVHDLALSFRVLACHRV